jgi:hypothetical protein
MKAAINRVRERRRTVIDAAMIFVVILLVTQMWLLTATLESYLAGHTDVAFPGMLVSAVLFAGCFALYRFGQSADRTPDG